MNRSRSTTKTSGGRARGRKANDGAPRWHPVGTRVRSRLVALERKLGLFANQTGYAAESRFRVASILPRKARLPQEMRRVFAEELESLERIGLGTERCQHSEFAPYDVYAISYFHYEGFQALVYVEREGEFLAAWKEVEVELTDSPRAILAREDSAPVEAFLEHVVGAA